MASEKRMGRGGARKGAGRKPTVPGKIRRNRVVVMLIDDDFEALCALADRREMPVGSIAYELLTKALRRARS